MINPYAVHLGDRRPLETIRQTPAALGRIAAALGPEGLAESLKPGGWTAIQIIGHLADTEIAFGFRLRQSLSEPHHVIQPFDQDRWAGLMPDRDAREALDAFASLRVGTLRLVEGLSSELLSRPVTHPERGVMTIADVVATIAGHDLNHLRQLETIAARRASTRQPAAFLKRFESPDERREFERGSFELVRLGGIVVGRATYQPGWRWSEHVGPGVGLSRCSVEHVGLVLEGAAVAAFDDGTVVDLTAGSLFYVPPVPHDSWVVGDRPYVSLHFLGSESYAR